MNAAQFNTTVKLNLSHNLTKIRMLEIRFDLLQSVLSLKENIAKRYGTSVENMELSLRLTRK